jgi:hypothetical protein
MQVEKFISYQIERQFPAYYRENGRELIEFVKAYYDFLERLPNQSTYNSRRLFEYRDIDNTLDSLVLFFKNKYLNDLPFNESTVRLTVKRILDLYRRKGNKESIDLFFQMFYDEKVKIYYPSVDILKPSDSKWETQKYLQLFPESPFLFKDITNERVFGTISKAEAVIKNAFFILVNGTFTPVIFINDIKGKFEGFDTLKIYNPTETRTIGVVYGSMDRVEIIDDLSLVPTTGNKIGDILTISDEYGTGGKLLVTAVSETFTGEIRYRLDDGGWGYSRENTLLLVSNQIVFLDESEARVFNSFDVISDQLGNSGVVIGQSGNVLGVRLESGQEFSNNSILQDSNSTVIGYIDVVPKNSTSPGPLFPEASNNEIDIAVAVDELADTEIIPIISDVISNYLNVQLDSANYNDPPALVPMSGTVDPIDITTLIEDAFSTTNLEIGRIVSFKNINPGTNYINDVFVIVRDPKISSIGRHDQIISFSGSNSLFNVGDEITQGGTKAKIIKVIDNKLFVRPYSLAGIQDNLTFVHKGLIYNILNVVPDYSSSVSGNNAIMNVTTDFATGKINEVKVINSGYGYIDRSIVTLIDSQGRPSSRARIFARGQGETEGAWTAYTSHIGPNFGKVIQDSDYYQDYSYEIRSKLGINNYEKVLKDVVHVAGTKLFGEFDFEDTVTLKTNIRLTIED